MTTNTIRNFEIWVGTKKELAVDKTRNMEHSGTSRNIPEHEKIFKILKK